MLRIHNVTTTDHHVVVRVDVADVIADALTDAARTILNEDDAGMYGELAQAAADYDVAPTEANRATLEAARDAVVPAAAFPVLLTASEAHRWAADLSTAANDLDTVDAVCRAATATA